MRRAIALTLVLVALGSGAASAHDHRPPGATMTGRGAEQEGRLITSCWIRGEELGGAAVCRQREMSFPEAVGTRPVVTIAFDTAAEPRRVRVRAWSSLRANGRPRRPARRLDAIVEQGPDGWGSRVELPPREGTWYLEVKGVWPDARFPESTQFAVWTFVAVTGESPRGA